MEAIIEAAHLGKVFYQKGKAPVRALEDVSFSLYPGETLGIVGESGSGKSTIAGLITRLCEPTEGTVLFEGTDITRAKGKELKGVYAKSRWYFKIRPVRLTPAVHWVMESRRALRIRG